jgi:serine carboxypeptidase-like clade 2
VIEDGTSNFVRNKYAWNLEATVIYLESPAGVGFSRCLNSSECEFDDDNSANDNLVAVLNLMT